MKFIAITGSFASGKSFVSNYLQEIGYKVFSCDDYVKNLYKDPFVQQDLIKLIGGLSSALIDDASGEFNKKKLAEIIFNDDNQRKKVEAYIHPKVKLGINSFKQNNLNSKLLFAEVPLLFEANFDIYFDYSLCVYCSEESRENRARNRSISGFGNNFDSKSYNRIKLIQLSQEEKKNLADFLVNTDKEPGDVKVQVNEIIERLNEC